MKSSWPTKTPTGLKKMMAGIRSARAQRAAVRIITLGLFPRSVMVPQGTQSKATRSTGPGLSRKPMHALTNKIMLRAHAGVFVLIVLVALIEEVMKR